MTSACLFKVVCWIEESLNQISQWKEKRIFFLYSVLPVCANDQSNDFVPVKWGTT